MYSFLPPSLQNAKEETLTTNVWIAQARTTLGDCPILDPLWPPTAWGSLGGGASSPTQAALAIELPGLRGSIRGST